MLNILIYTLLSVFIISLVSFIGIFTLSIKKKNLQNIILYFVSFSAGALFGDVFIHLLPEAVEEFGFGLNLSLYILVGIIFFFIIEKIIKWRHCHHVERKGHKHSFVYMNLIGDGFHNFIDGLIIAASYLVSLPVGIATTIAVVLHEIPQEIGDFGVLLHGGFSKVKALWINFFSGIFAILGAIIGLIISNQIEGITLFLVPFAVGGFIYIAGSDLIPELHKEVKLSKSILQLTVFLLGILVMLALVFID